MELRRRARCLVSLCPRRAEAVRLLSGRVSRPAPVFVFLVAIGTSALGCTLLNGTTKMGSAVSMATEVHEVSTAPQVKETTRIAVTPSAQPKALVTVTVISEPVTPGSAERVEKTVSAATAPVEVPTTAGAQALKGEPPKAEVPSTGPVVSGGLTTWTKKAEAGARGAILYIVGGLALVAGIALAAGFGQLKIGGGIAIGGAALAALGYGMDTYPWLVWVLLGLMLLAAVAFIWYVWSVAKLKADNEVKTAFAKIVVPAIQAVAPKGEADPTTLKGKILELARIDGVVDPVSALVDEVKAEKGLK